MFSFQPTKVHILFDNMGGAADFLIFLTKGGGMDVERLTINVER
jgi:hypothetical protein